MDELVASIRRRVDPGVQAGDLLLDQRVACGIGNVYKSEALWAERVDPFAPFGALDDALLAAVYGQARQQMLAAVRGGREGPHRIYRPSRAARAAAGPSARARRATTGRTTYWCEACLALPPDRPP